MKVILLRDVPKLGQKNDVKDVSDGFARNFLLPRRLVKLATQESLKQLVRQTAKAEVRRSEEHQLQRAWLDQMKSLVLHFPVRAGEKGKAFGSVTTVKIQTELAKHGIRVEKDWIELEEPIKTIGEKKVPIRFPHAGKGEINLMLEAKS